MKQNKKLMEEIPDRFWGLFRSVNRSTYIEALLRINEEYEYSNYFLSREVCIQVLSEYFAKKRYVIWQDELEDELDTVATRTADPFYIAEETKAELREVHKYWKGKTSSELATSYMDPEAIKAIEHNIFTPGNYFYNGVGHVTVKYGEVLAIGYKGIIDKAQAELDKCQVGDANYVTKSHFLRGLFFVRSVKRCVNIPIW